MVKQSYRLKNILFYSLVFILVTSYAAGFVFDIQTMILLVIEDGPYENVGAFFFLVASCLFFLSYFASKEGNDFFVLQLNKNIFYLLLGILFFFIFGEEISWGQRIFGIETPDYLKSENIQNETNLHNLKIFNSVDEQNIKRPWYDIFSMSRLFKVFWFLYCFAVPVLDRFSSPFSAFLKRINLPMIPLWIGVLLPVNYLLSKVMEIVVSDRIRFVEVEETNHAILFAAAAFWLYIGNKYSSVKKDTSEPVTN